MKKLITLLAVVMLGLGVQAASSMSRGGYLYWSLDPVDESIAFAYAMMAVEKADGSKSYLTVSDPILGDTAETVIFDADTIPDTVQLGECYSKLLDDPEGSGYYLELYNMEGEIVGTTQTATYAQLYNGGYIYSDMSTGGIQSPYRYAAVPRPIPEPTGGILLMLGLGVLALRRKHVDIV